MHDADVDDDEDDDDDDDDDIDEKDEDNDGDEHDHRDSVHQDRKQGVWASRLFFTGQVFCRGA